MRIMDINQPSVTLTLAANTTNRVLVGAETNYVTIYNPGTAIVYLKSGNSSVNATVGGGGFVAPNDTITFEKNRDHTHIAGISAAGVVLVIQAGEGI